VACPATSSRSRSRPTEPSRPSPRSRLRSARASTVDYLFVATRGTRTVERIDVLRDQLSGSIADVGLAPNGLALSPDDRFLYVDAYLSREVVVYDVSSFDTAPTPLARLPIVSVEPLAPDLLRGKQLFNDALDPRLGSDGYIACAHCHLDGLDDHRTWDFTDRGEGLRNTTSLLGAPGTGAIHWSANFDELQDFEHDIRGPFRGTGLMSDADFHTGTRDTTLGDPKAGVSADLDALAAYVASLDRLAPSPHRGPDGSLPEAAARGRAIFESSETGCTTPRRLRADAARGARRSQRRRRARRHEPPERRRARRPRPLSPLPRRPQGLTARPLLLG